MLKKRLFGNEGFSLLEGIVFSATALSTALAVYSVFNETVQSNSDDTGRLMFYQSVSRAERSIPKSCMANLFTLPDDPDRKVPEVGQSKHRRAIYGIKVDETFKAGRTIGRYSDIQLTYKKYLGRDVGYFVFDIEAELKRDNRTIKIRDSFPVFGRVNTSSGGEEVIECSAADDVESADFLAYIGAYMHMARIKNSTNFYEFVLCVAMVSTSSCSHPPIWALREEIPADIPPPPPPPPPVMLVELPIRKGPMPFRDEMLGAHIPKGTVGITHAGELDSRIPASETGIIDAVIVPGPDGR